MTYNITFQTIGGYGTLYTLGERDAFMVRYEEFPDEFDSFYFQSCFATYFGRYHHSDSPNKKLYFAFPLMPSWYADVVQEFNSTFKNIQFEILADKTLNGNCADARSAWDGEYYQVSVYKRKQGNLELHTPAFTIHMSDLYAENSVRHLQYALSIFLRMMSIGEGFMLPTYIPEDGQYIKTLLDMSNKFPGYRSFSERNDISISDFLYFDDPERVNKVFKFGQYDRPSLQNYIKQTAIVDSIRHGVNPYSKNYI